MEYKKKGIKEYLFPHRCPFCGRAEEKEICIYCAEKVVYIEEPRCKKCGKPVRKAEQEYCHDCGVHPHYFEEGRSLWIHKPPVNQSVYQFKYGGRRIYGEYYVRKMAEMYGRTIKRWGIDQIVPVPLHPGKQRKRGYNQAWILASGLAELTGVPADEKGILRVRFTVPQKQLSDRQRKKNLKGAFQTAKGFKPGKNVLVVDDIYTTGCTIDEVSRVLLLAGAEKVFFLTISVGQGF